MNAGSKTITIFWSWQSDSPSRENRNFIQDCLERAARNVAKSEAQAILVDRDTQGIGGTPKIAETILAKIRSSDIFVWDATLVYTKPRPSPNPNVLLELGYAFALLGEGRMIGVMNTADRSGPSDLPFDLTHRRCLSRTRLQLHQVCSMELNSSSTRRNVIKCVRIWLKK